MDLNHSSNYSWKQTFLASFLRSFSKKMLTYSHVTSAFFLKRSQKIRSKLLVCAKYLFMGRIVTHSNVIGIFGGTFDPIHLGHLYLAEQVIEKLKCKKIYFLPANQPVHRALPKASAEDRLAMVKLATADRKEFIADDREIRRQGPSYMIDTVKSFRKDFPDSPLWLLIATDAFEKFDTWRDYEKILDYCHLVIIQRKGFQNLSKWSELKKIANPSELLTKLNGCIYFSSIKGLPISSTEIRNKRHSKENVKEFLPEKVWQYIREKNYILMTRFEIAKKINLCTRQNFTVLPRCGSNLMSIKRTVHNDVVTVVPTSIRYLINSALDLFRYGLIFQAKL